MAKTKKKSKPVDTQEAIKRLLIVLLLTRGVEASDIAKTLGYEKSMIGKLVPARKIQKLLKNRNK